MVFGVRSVAVGPSGLRQKSRRLVPLIHAVQHVRRMRGGAQSHLMRCADGFYYVVKFQNNPQHTRVLVNDWLGTRLAEMIGLPVPVAAIVDVDPWLLEHTPDLRIELCGQRMMFTAGLSFGSRYVVSPFEGQIYDYLPEDMIRASAISATLPASSRSTNGPATLTAARQLSGSAVASASSPPASSIKVIVSTLANGTFLTHRCAASSAATTFTSVSHRGTALSRGSAASKPSPKARSGRWRKTFRPNGIAAQATNWSAYCRVCSRAAPESAS